MQKTRMPLLKRHGSLTPAEERAKICELRTYINTLHGIDPQFCSDSCLCRYLRATHWSQKKARKMIKETIKWREQYKPHQIKWEDIAEEAETGKIYRANFRDKAGRTVLVMRPGVQNINQFEVQLKYLVYCMENAISSLPADQEQLVWLVDFEAWSMSNIPLKTAKETALVLQNHYPERLAYAILFNPPKVFEMFWNVIKPFLDPATQKKVKFVYGRDDESAKVMEGLFDMDKLERAFGGRNSNAFSREEYANSMKEEERRRIDLPAHALSAMDLNGNTSSVVNAENHANGNGSMGNS